MNAPQPRPPLLADLARGLGVPADRFVECERLAVGTGRPLLSVLVEQGCLSSAEAAQIERRVLADTEAPARGTGGPPLPDAPRRVGRYEIVRPLGEGGMGVVYLARDPELGREVALKVLKTDAPERFASEAQVIAQLRHPNIVPLFEKGQAEGRHYFTMEYVSGGSLEQAIRAQGKLAPAEAMRILRATAEAVAYAHRNRVIHRDLKPGNILLEPGVEPRPRIVDFGLARTLAESETRRFTESGTVLGSLLHMAPEQAGGRTQEVDERSDVYALGSTLYEALTGVPPYPADTKLQILYGKLFEDPEPPRHRVPSLSRDVETIVMKALERDPSRRYAGAQELADDLGRCLGGEAIRARPPSRAERLRRLLARHRREVVAACAAALAVAVWLGVAPALSAWWRGKAAAAERESRRAEASRRLDEVRTLAGAERWAEAAAAGEELLARFEEHDDRGEDVAVPETHLCLAHVHEAQGDGARALRERYRALEGWLRRPASDAALLHGGIELATAARYDEAVPWLADVAGHAADPGRRAEAEYWLGRCAEGEGEFGAALDHFAHALGGASAPGAWAGDARQRADFCADLGRTVLLPVQWNTLTAADLDGDGRNELIGSRRAELFVGSVRDGVWRERTRHRVTALGAPDVCAVAVLPIPDPGHPCVLAGGATPDERTGRLSLLRFADETLREVASIPLEAYARCFGWGDLDGDGVPELVLGTQYYDESLRVYSWDGTAAAPALRCRVHVESDVWGIDLVDLDGDGAVEVVAGIGQWRAYGVQIFRWDRETATLVAGPQQTIGVPSTLVRLSAERTTARYAVGVGWDRQMLEGLLAKRGEAWLREKCLPPGGYVLGVSAAGIRVQGALDSCGRVGDRGWCLVVRVRGRSGESLWCAYDEISPHGLRDQVFRNGDFSRPWIALDSGGTGRFCRILALDLDGDGWDEIVLPASDAIRYLDDIDPVRVADGPRSVARRAPAPRSAAQRSLVAAAAAEAYGLWEEAESAFVRAGEQSSTPTETSAAAVGRSRCLLRLGRAGDAADLVLATAEASPATEKELLTAALEQFDRARCWPEALRLARRLQRSAGLPRTARDQFAAQAEQYQFLAEMPWRFPLLGPKAPPLDWLATSPLPVHPQSGGGWRIRTSSDGFERFLLPIANVGQPWIVEGELGIARHEYATGLRFGLATLSAPAQPRGRPFRGLFAWAGGASNAPLYSLMFESPTAIRTHETVLFERATPWEPAPIPWEVSLIAHQGLLAARSAGKAPATLPALVPEGDTVYAGFETHGNGSPGSNAEFHIPRLQFRSASGGAFPIRFESRDGLDHLLLANGRWIQGRTDEALEQYAEAIRHGDATDADERLTFRDVGRWVPVDARVYRGLLRAALGDEAGAVDDLGAARARSAERVLALARRHAFALEDRPREREMLARFAK